GNQVHQGPADLYKNQRELAKMECSHSISSYNVILWYKQSNYREFVYLGYMIGTSGFPEVGFDIEGDANAGGTSTLTIKQLTPNSSAVYYCAASLHSASDLPLCSTKTSSLVYCRLITPVLTSHCI
uniref:Ig-like domain-containing protein n=1 Tax=Oncorhynchus mykiss TaxID=8022 RepID=A0A8K9UVF8_ONCMY